MSRILSTSKMQRVSNQQRCPICLKDSWCLVSEDAAICMRVQGGKEHTFNNHAVGWLHRLKEPLPRFTPRPQVERPKLNVKDLLTEWYGDLHGPRIESLAKSLGVTFSALKLLGCVWAERYQAWAFPMRGGDGEYNGIRLRNDTGRKWAVSGSREGVFFAFGIPNAETLYVVEGPTDAAAGLSIGLDCVGRPSCYGGVEEIRIIARNAKYRQVVVVSDNDEAGRRGAKGLADALFVPHCILTLPAKDMREFVRNGGTESVLKYMTDNSLWSRRAEKP